MTMTASTLYEAVEPHTVWKQLLNSVILEILGQASEVEVRDLQYIPQAYDRINFRRLFKW